LVKRNRLIQLNLRGMSGLLRAVHFSFGEWRGKHTLHRTGRAAST